MNKRLIKPSFIFLILIVVVVFLSSGQNLIEAATDFQKVCQTSQLDQAEKDLNQSEYRQLLQDCLDYYDRYYQTQEEVYQSQLNKVQGHRRSLEDELAYLENRIAKLNAQMQKSRLVMRDLNLEIKDKINSIKVTQDRIDRYRQELINLIQLTYQSDKRPVALEILAGGRSLSDIFRDLAVLGALNERLQELLKGANDLKSYLQKQQNLKEAELENLQKELVIQSFQKEDLSSTQAQKDELLAKTKGQEILYKKQLSKVKTEAQKKVGEIKSRLFRLIDVPQGGIEFGKAVEVAESVSQLTGVKPAFLLAILAQESSEHIGANVGGCYLTNLKTGTGVYIKTGEVAPKTMNPKRDIPPFLNLLKKLGKDYKTTPVSCCIFRNGQPWGWGGAMGPAQFIPSTWAIYADQVQQLLGKAEPANPWAVQDSFLAAALYLKKLGANGTYRGELNAALGYFGCHSAWCVANYGKPVLERAAKYEQEIKMIHEAE